MRTATGAQDWINRRCWVPDSYGAEGYGRFDKDTDVPSKGPGELFGPQTKRNSEGGSLRAFVLLCGCVWVLAGPDCVVCCVWPRLVRCASILRVYPLGVRDAACYGYPVRPWILARFGPGPGGDACTPGGKTGRGLLLPVPARARPRQRCRVCRLRMRFVILHKRSGVYTVPGVSFSAGCG